MYLLHLIIVISWSLYILNVLFGSIQKKHDDGERKKKKKEKKKKKVMLWG